VTFVLILVALVVAAFLTAAGNRRRGRARPGGAGGMLAQHAGSWPPGFAAGRGVEPPGPVSRGQPLPSRVARCPQEPSGSVFATSSPGAPTAPHPAQCSETLRILKQMSTLLPDDSLRERLRETVILEHMHYALHIAALYSSHGEPGEATYATARSSLARAVDEYDHESGIDFLAYATPVILREVRALRTAGSSAGGAPYSSALSNPRRSRHLADALPGCADRLTEQFGRRPTIAELASAMGVRSEDVVESLDAALGKRAMSADFSRRIPDADRDGADNVLDFKVGLNREQVKILLAPLSERNKRIVMMRYLRGMTDAQIGAELNISPVHVHRLLNQAMTALRAAEPNRGVAPAASQPAEPHNRGSGSHASDGASSVAA
jgi:RNA polymerase sigma-B factor